MSYKTINNFLDKKQLSATQSIIFDLEFPWRRRKELNDNCNNGIYFTYGFYNNMEINSPYFMDIIKPILEKLNSMAPIQVRSNMFISKLFKKSAFHVDYEDTKSKTAILYLNTCDGGTEIKINNKVKFIKAVENKILIFDTNTLHRAITSIESPIRYIINLNYYER
tara:strand:+ start:24 stop:521 length:498 start_codon:yes stop_codon:yes gene_type:complete